MYLDFLVLSAFAVKNAIFSQSASSLLQQTQYICKRRKKEKFGEEILIGTKRDSLTRHQTEFLPELVLQVVDFPVHPLVRLNIVVQLSLSLDRESYEQFFLIQYKKRKI